MSEKIRRALDCSVQTIETNLPIIEQILKKAGVAVSPELVFTAAKYYEALNRLAHE